MKEYFRSFFYSGDNPQPVYFYIYILFTLIVIMIVLRIFFGRVDIDTSLILGMCGYTGGWATLLTVRQHFKERNGNGHKDKICEED